MSREAVMMFSGGIDCTYAVEKVIDRFDRLFLVTYVVPLSILNLRASKSGDHLARLHPGKISHEYVDIRSLIQDIRGDFQACRRDNRRFRFAYAWCLGCKLAMHTATIRYCLDHGVTTVMDGSHSADMHALEQKPQFLEAIDGLYREFGITKEHPIYDDYADASAAPIRETLLERMYLVDHRKDQVKALEARGFDFGPAIGNHRRTIQPQCLFALGLNIKRLFHDESPDAAREYFEDKLPRVRQALAGWERKR